MLCHVSALLMSTNMEQPMSGIPEKPSKYQEKSAVSATVRARDMLCDLSGPRGWNDTRESWLARGARKAGLSIRRARALFYAEPIRLSADEYLAIEKAYENAHSALAALSVLAGDADVRADRAAAGRSGAPVREGEPADGPERPAAHASVQSR